jgi:transposase
MRPYGNPKQLERRRRHAIELLKKTKNLLAVSRKIGCSVSSVFRWWNEYQKKGSKALDSKPVPGRPPKLSHLQQRMLTRFLLKGAMNCGYTTDLWTQRRVTEVIEDRFGISYHPNHLWRFLMGLGWSCQKPEKRARERDEKAIAYWKSTTWQYIKKSPKT